MFDKTRPFGAVSGHPTGAAYEQNGNLYYANGEPVETPIDAPIDALIDALIDAPIDAPVDAPVDTPVETPAPRASKRR